MESLDFTDAEVRDMLRRSRCMAELLRNHGETSATFWDASVRALEKEVEARGL